jgi:hypothetical protein
MLRRLTGFFAACALAALLAGCNLVGFGYSQGETIAAWKADEYFDLAGAQKDEFRARFSRIYAWHRYQQLPDYVAFLTQGKTRLQDGLSHEDVQWVVDGVQSRYAVLVNRAVDDAADMLLTLTPQQLTALQNQWRKDNRKFLKEQAVTGSVEERNEARAKRILKDITEWTGELTREQEQRVTQVSNALPDIARFRYEDRVRRQREFVKLVEQKLPKAEFSARLKEWLIDWKKGRPAQYQRAADAHWDKRAELYMEVERMLTPQQRARVFKHLQTYIDDFRGLSQGSNRTADSR